MTHSHHGHTHETEQLSDGRLVAAVAFNLLLTVVELVGGIVSGSLSLVADALHNFNDCGSLVIALVARRIARKPADRTRTFGYRRAEVIGALINLTVLIVVGLFLVYEAIDRFISPREIEGWIVIVVAGVALIVDVVTAGLLFAMSKGSLNVKAAFLHNVSDALASVGVIVVGVAILLWDFYLLDVLVTLLIAAYILWQSVGLIRQAIHILMESVPSDISIEDLLVGLRAIDGVIDVHHIHVWQLDEEHRAFEGHIVVRQFEVNELELIKSNIKSVLAETFRIGHSTLEFETEELNADTTHDNQVISEH